MWRCCWSRRVGWRSLGGGRDGSVCRCGVGVRVAVGVGVRVGVGVGVGVRVAVGVGVLVGGLWVAVPGSTGIIRQFFQNHQSPQTAEWIALILQEHRVQNG